MRIIRKQKLGIIISLENEAHALTGRRRWHSEAGFRVIRAFLNNGVPFIGVCSGVGMDLARRAANWLATQGVTALVSCGVSGGLAPNLRTGDLIIAEKVYKEGGCQQKNAYLTSEPIRQYAHTFLAQQQMIAHCGPIVSTRKAVLTISGKARLYHHYQALAVDMESAAVAGIACKAGLPVFILRAVCDPATMSVAPDIFACVNSDGQIRPWFIIRRLLQKPAFITDLWQNQQTFSLAMRNLKLGWRLLSEHKLGYYSV